MNNSILKDVTYGMYIVSSSFEDKNSGCTINTLSQITSKSNIVAISLNKNNYTNEIIKKSRNFAISILSKKTPPSIIGTFGFKSSKDFNKFENINTIVKNNIKIVSENICGYIVCKVVNIISVDTHDIILGEIVDSEKTSHLEPMTYSYYHEEIKGTTSPNAPTYIENKETETSIIYKCLICAYEYNEGKENIAFDNLPDDWVCPICGAPKSVFEKTNKG